MGSPPMLAGESAGAGVLVAFVFCCALANSWRIATYVSMVVILGLLAYNLFGGSNRVKIDESLAKSIAVLPFENFSTEPDQEAMCMGLTDEIINHLYRIESFDHVSSLTSVLNYMDPEKNIPEIAKETSTIISQ